MRNFNLASDEIGRLGQLLVHPAIGYEFTPDVIPFIGYAYVRAEPVGARSTDQHRVLQQLNTTHCDFFEPELDRQLLARFTVGSSRPLIAGSPESTFGRGMMSISAD